MASRSPELERFQSKFYGMYLAVAVPIVGLFNLVGLRLIALGAEELLNRTTSLLNAWSLIAIALLAMATITFAALVAIRQHATIGIDDEGLKTYYLGRWRKCIKWQEITRIHKVSEYDPSSYRFATRYLVHTQECTHNFLARMLANSSSRRGGIFFDENTADLRRLLDRINEYARQYKIPLEAIDKREDGPKASGVGVTAF